MMETLNVKPELIRWAIQRSGRSVDTLARHFPKIAQWEAGEAQPTLRQLESLVKKTWTPLGYFFLPPFAQVFYKPPERQSPADHAHMQRHLQPAVDRFKAIAEEDKRQEFRDKLSGYVKVYAFLSQIIPYAASELEMLYSFGRFLLPHLPLGRDTTVVNVGDEVELQYYRLERVFSGVIEVWKGDAQYVKSLTEVGTGKPKDEKAPLSEIIEVLNERFGTQFTEEDPLFFQQIKEKACKDKQVIQTALANPLDKFELGIRKLIEDFMIERMADNDCIVTRYMADRDFQGSAFPILAREIFESIRAGSET